MKKFLIGIIFLCNYAFSQTESKVIKNVIGEELYKNFTGKVCVKKTSEKSLLLFFSTTGANKDFFDKSILIETITNGQIIVLDKNDNCEVFIPLNKKYIIVNNLTKNKIIYLGLYDVNNIIQSVSGKLKASTNNGGYFLGYGLSYMENKWDKMTVKNEKSLDADYILLKSNLNIVKAVKTNNATSDNPGGATCHSGGVGSSQCSIEEGFPTTQVCSVTCNVGYYACCNTTTFTCKCIANAVE